jgi:hypothetical protein
MTRQAYGSGSMTERGPGVWSLRVMVDGKQRQETFRAPRRQRARVFGTWPPGVARTASVTATSNGRTFGDL